MGTRLDGALSGKADPAGSARSGWPGLGRVPSREAGAFVDLFGGSVKDGSVAYNGKRDIDGTPGPWVR